MKASPLQHFIASLESGYLNSPTLPMLIALERLQPVLIRCDGCRFTCPAQHAAHLMLCVSAGGDYVRDVSIPADAYHAARAAVEAEVNQLFNEAINQARPLAGLAPLPAIAPLPPLAQVPEARMFTEPADQKPTRCAIRFNEADCGGAWDGFSVSSDCDSGL